MMKSRITMVVILVLSASLITGCGKQDEDKGAASSQTPATSAPASPAVVVEETPPSIDPNLAASGEAIYNQNCIFCHQADAIGKPGFAPSLTNKELLSAASNKFLMGTIRDGRPGTGMPPFAHLGKQKVEAIVAYLRSHAKLADHSAEVDAQPTTQGDPRLGQLWFKQICSTCHGPDGNGYAAGSTGTAIGKAGFLNKATDGFIRTTIVQGRSNTRMLGFQGPAAMADLSDREIDDIIAYLRTEPSK